VNQRSLLYPLIALAGGLGSTGTRGDGPAAAPESYMPWRTEAGVVKTCTGDAGGNSTCGPATLGAAAPDALRLGLLMSMLSGLSGPGDKRWDRFVYGVAGKPCADGGTSLGAIRTESGVHAKVRAELDGAIAAGVASLAKEQVDGLDVYVGYLDPRRKDCIVAFGYPDDGTAVLALTAKDDRDKLRRTFKSMLDASKAAPAGR
jgi:hypothetical protein